MSYHQFQRVAPVSCPLNFPNRYTVTPGDTMWLIAQHFGVPLNALIEANPHIINPNNLIPGDILCIPVLLPPQEIAMPCCTIMNPSLPGLPVDAKGVAMVNKLVELRPGRTAISLLAFGLPAPATLGNFNSYQALATIPGLISWQWQLYSIPSDVAPIWSGVFTEITAQLTPNSMIYVRPINTTSSEKGGPVLTGILANCR